MATYSSGSALAAGTPALRRELGRWALTAIGINQVIGSAVFRLPADLAASVGAWSPLLVAAIGLASLLIALCFAEVSSRFEATGGSRVRVALASTVSLALLVWFVFVANLVMLRSTRRLHLPVAWFRLLRWSVSLGFTVLPLLAASWLPGHHPRSLADPSYLPQWLRGMGRPRE